MRISGAARGRKRGKLPAYGGDVQKLCNIVMQLLRTSDTLQGRRAKSDVDTQTIQPGLGDFVLDLDPL